MNKQPLPNAGAAAVLNRGRGPEIQGTRITVYDVLDYQMMGWSTERIAKWLNLSLPEVQAATAYIESHRDEVARDYQAPAERAGGGNSTEVRARVDAAHQKFIAKLSEGQRRRVEALFRGGSSDINGARRAAGRR